MAPRVSRPGVTPAKVSAAPLPARMSVAVCSIWPGATAWPGVAAW